MPGAPRFTGIHNMAMASSMLATSSHLHLVSCKRCLSVAHTVRPSFPIRALVEDAILRGLEEHLVGTSPKRIGIALPAALLRDMSRRKALKQLVNIFAKNARSHPAQPLHNGQHFYHRLVLNNLKRFRALHMPRMERMLLKI